MIYIARWDRILLMYSLTTLLMRATKLSCCPMSVILRHWLLRLPYSLSFSNYHSHFHYHWAIMETRSLSVSLGHYQIPHLCRWGGYTAGRLTASSDSLWVSSTTFGGFLLLTRVLLFSFFSASILDAAFEAGPAP